MDDLKDIVPAAVTGAGGAGLVAWLARMFLKEKFDAISRHTDEIADIKQKMATREDLNETAENIKQEITLGYGQITSRIDALFARLGK